MGKLSDALKRAEEERRRRREAGAPEPAAAPPVETAARKGGTHPPPGVMDSPPRAGAPQAAPERAAPAPPPPRAALRQPPPEPVPLAAEPAAGRPDQRLICFHHRRDGVVEQFRQLRTNLLALDREHSPPRVMVITSTAPGEGKTLTCANLAIALADYVAGPVLAIDGDLRQPRLHDLFGILQAPGFSDVLAGQVPLSQALRKACVANLHVLTAGQQPDNPTSLLGSQQARRLLAEARRAFSYVIIDTPPVINLTDASILGAQVDGALMLVRTGRTSREAVARGLDLLGSAGVRVLGTILTWADNVVPGYTYRPR